MELERSDDDREARNKVRSQTVWPPRVSLDGWFSRSSRFPWISRLGVATDRLRTLGINAALAGGFTVLDRGSAAGVRNRMRSYTKMPLYYFALTLSRHMLSLVLGTLWGQKYPAYRHNTL